MTTPPRARVYSKKKNGGNCKISENTREDRDEDRKSRKNFRENTSPKKFFILPTNYPTMIHFYFTLTFSALRETIFLFSIFLLLSFIRVSP